MRELVFLVIVASLIAGFVQNVFPAVTQKQILTATFAPIPIVIGIAIAACILSAIFRK